MKTILVILSIITSHVAYCSYRPVLIKKELQSASFVGEVVFVGYDSLLVSKYSEFQFPVKMDSASGKNIRYSVHDSVWVISKIYYQKLHSGKDSINNADVYSINSGVRYQSRPHILPKKGVSNGFWPKLNDSCFIVIDSASKVSIFAMIENDRYIFWDPYFNTGWNSVFIFNDHFECYPLNGKNSNNHSLFKHIAEFFKMNYASQYHCAINRQTLWDEIINESQ